MTKGAAFYDLDKTIIAKSSTLAFRRPFALAGLMGSTDSAASAAAQGYYRVAGATSGQLEDSKARLSTMIDGWPVDKVESLVAGTVEQLIAPYVYIDALKTIQWHKDNGREVVIISSSPREWVEPIGFMIGADRVIATQLEVSGGKYTGEILFYAYGEQKAVALKALAKAEGVDLSESWSYTDSFTDLPMLEAVGHPVAVNPDSALRTAAEEHGWETVQFVRPPSWDSPLSFVWDAAAALPDVSAALRIGITGTLELAEGAVVATRDATVALTGILTRSEDDLPFFPSVRSRNVRGLNPVTMTEVRDSFTADATGAVSAATESVTTATADLGERGAQVAEAAAEVIRKGTAKAEPAPMTKTRRTSRTKSTAAKSAAPKASTATESTAAKSRATKSTATKSTAAKPPATKSTATKSTATKSTATKSTAAKPRATKASTAGSSTTGTAAPKKRTSTGTTRSARASTSGKPKRATKASGSESASSPEKPADEG